MNEKNYILEKILELPSLNVDLASQDQETELTPKEAFPVIKTTEWINKDLPPEIPLVEGFMWKNALSVLAGSSKAGKTTMARLLAYCVATGKPFLGMKTYQCPVLYAALEEDHRRTKRHFWTLGLKEGDQLDLVTARVKRSNYKIVIEGLREQIIENKYGLVIIDTAGHMPKENKSGSSLDYDQTLDWWYDYMDIAQSDLDVAIVLMFHMPKNASYNPNRDPINSLYGSAGLGSIVDQAYAIWREADGSRSIEAEGRLPNFPDTKIILDEQTLLLELGQLVERTKEDKHAATEDANAAMAWDIIRDLEREYFGDIPYSLVTDQMPIQSLRKVNAIKKLELQGHISIRGKGKGKSIQVTLD